MPFYKCIYKDLLTNLNVRFCFLSKRDSWKPPTYQTKLISFEKNMSRIATISYVMFEKNHKKTDRIVNYDKEKYEINSLHAYSCYDSYVRKYSLYGFRKIKASLL